MRPLRPALCALCALYGLLLSGCVTLTGLTIELPRHGGRVEATLFTATGKQPAPRATP